MIARGEIVLEGASRSFSVRADRGTSLKELVTTRFARGAGRRGRGAPPVQALDGVKFEPFDLKIALPDPASNGKAPPNATISPNARKFAANEMPDDIGKPRER